MNRPDTDAWERTAETMARAWPLDRWADVGVVIGCSGGADSTALVRLLHGLSVPADTTGDDDQGSGVTKLVGAKRTGAKRTGAKRTGAKRTGAKRRGFLVVAHFDHRLRGHESDGDRDFVTQLADELGLRCAIGSGDADRADEAYLRNQRYAFLQRTAAETGCRYIALAHSLDDNVETVLYHLMRGTGPAGLAGIAPMRVAGSDFPESDFVIARPLLGVRRDQIRQTLQEMGQPWREDSSNRNTDYQRNWIRGELLPLMQTRFPESVPAIGRAIESQRDWRDVIDEAASQWIGGNVQVRSGDPDGRTLVIARRTDHQATIVIAALQSLWRQQNWSRTAMTQRHWRQISDTICSPAQKDDQHDDQSAAARRYSLPNDIDVIATDSEVTVARTTRTRKADRP